MYNRLLKISTHVYGTLLITLYSQMALGQKNVTDIVEDPPLLYNEEHMLSIATGTLKPMHWSPAAATVITAQEIKAMGARTLSEALAYVPGLHVSISFNRFSKIYSIRGIHTHLNPQVLFLINGNPATDIITGSRYGAFRMSTAHISRIEVLRGPGSAVYGADALSGVINVITKDKDEIGGTTVGARTGSFDTQDLWIQHGSTYKGWEISFSFDYAKSDGDKKRILDSDLQTLLDNTPTLASKSNGPASLAPRSATTFYQNATTWLTLNKDNWQIELNSWNLRDTGQGVGAIGAVDPVGRQNTSKVSGVVTYETTDLAEHLDLSAKVGYIKSDRQAKYQLLPPGSVLLMAIDGNIKNNLNDKPAAGFALYPEGMHGNPGGNIEQHYLETALTYSSHYNHRVRLALGVKYDNAKSKTTKNFGPGVLDLTGFNMTTATEVSGDLTDVTGTEHSFMPNVSRRIKHLSLQDEWTISPGVELISGIRYDHYSDFGGTTNPRLALLWATNHHLTTKLLYGRAFRAPSFIELYFVNNPAALGNPDLKPETIDVIELVFDYHPTFDLHTVFNVFRYDLDRLIDQVDGKAQNINDQDGYGLEASIQWEITDQLSLLANYAWQASEDSKTGSTIPDAPAHQAAIAIHYKTLHNCLLSPQANWVGERVRENADKRPEIGNYTLVDVTLRCDLKKMPIEIALGVRNAFNEDAREPTAYNTLIGAAPIPNDFPLESRSVFLEAIYRFGE